MLQERQFSLYKATDRMDTEQRGAEVSLVTEQLSKLTDTKPSSYTMNRSESGGNSAFQGRDVPCEGNVQKVRIKTK